MGHYRRQHSRIGKKAKGLNKSHASRFSDEELLSILNRDEIQVDMQRFKHHFHNQTILITGAGGSIGSEITRQVSDLKPSRVILLGHGEHSIYQIHREMSDGVQAQETDYIPVIADIKNQEQMRDVMKKYQPHFIFHAAAHKHVSLMERNMKEAILNNVLGTYHIAKAAVEENVQSFMLISTDKATKPCNIMGATKRIAEMIVSGLNEEGDTICSSVRFGNVMDSRGSVLPLFKEQIEQGGPITLTDSRMTRYFMTIQEASRLLIQAVTLAEGGEVFVLDMGEAINIYDLAQHIIHSYGLSDQDIEIKEIGIQTGEKLHEDVILDGLSISRKISDNIYVGQVDHYPVVKILHMMDQFCSANLEDRQLREKILDLANMNY